MSNPQQEAGIISGFLLQVSAVTGYSPGFRGFLKMIREQPPIHAEPYEILFDERDSPFLKGRSRTRENI